METVDRRNKLSRIKELGIDPYQLPNKNIIPIFLVRTNHDPSYTRDNGPVYSVGGKIILLRLMGKLNFITISDGYKEIQLALEYSRLNEVTRELVKNLDLGDIVIATGNLASTKTGEITIWATELALGAKCLVTPPDKREGLHNLELRYRNRHMDLWNPEVKDVMVKRSNIISFIRNYLTTEGFLEVETPVMQPLPGGATAKPFVTHHNALDSDLYLRIAPELYLKRLLIGGINKVFEIGKNFRNEGMSTKHSPEFTFLEAYKAYANYEDMMQLLQNLITECVISVFKRSKIQYGDNVIDFAQKFDKVKYYPGIEETIMQPTFVTHHPSVPMAKVSKEHPDCCEDFELIIAGQEIAPGYTELNDPDQQLANFGDDCKDEDFIEAMKYGMPPSGGIGLGIDRLVAILTNQPSIKDVILFPLLKEKT